MSKEELIKDKVRVIADFRRRRKINQVKYAKAVKSIVDSIGSVKEAKKLLEKTYGLKIDESTLRKLNKAASIFEKYPEIEQMVGDGKLKFTIVFELESLPEDKMLEVARAVSGLDYPDARKVLKRIKENMEKPPQEVREQVLAELEKMRVTIALMAVPKDICETLSKQGISVSDAVVKALEEWVKEGCPKLEGSAELKEPIVVPIRLPRLLYKVLRRKTRHPVDLAREVFLNRVSQIPKDR